MRHYTLITGVTGLLGAYLLRDLLSRDVPCAVLVRPSRMESATQRIESILAAAERKSGTILPRPVVLEGTLSDNLGLDAENTRWVRRHCRRLLHNAASLVFERDPKTDEPYRSNVAGTKYAIEFALSCKIPQFHHISTAYVCGLRDGVCRENELDVGQEWGNDYEKAKVAAEKMVRNAPFLEPPTFYRPAIITGDSVTGYTSTYHGFYTPLKVAATLTADQSFQGSADDILHFLGMKGDEHKNFVPVEWISQAIVSLAERSESVGQTFHLTPKNRVAVRDMYNVFAEAMRRYGERHSAKTSKKENAAASLSPEQFQRLMISFRDQMKVYRSYWRDDPIFDASQTDAALPDLPCPEMTDDVLLRLSSFALESNFGWPKASPIVPSSFIRDFFPVKPTVAPADDVDSATQERGVALSVAGPGGGDWTFQIENERIVAVENGVASNVRFKVSLNSSLYEAILKETVSLRRAIASGAIFAEASGFEPLNKAEVVRFLATVIPFPRGDRS